MKNKVYELRWEILSASELVGHLPANAPTPVPLLRRIYTGNGMRLMDSPKRRYWKITIYTKARDNDGVVHLLKMQYIPDTPMFLSDLINAVKHQWLDECDKTLKDMDAIEAKASARCMA